MKSLILALVLCAGCAHGDDTNWQPPQDACAERPAWCTDPWFPCDVQEPVDAAAPEAEQVEAEAPWQPGTGSGSGGPGPNPWK